MSLVLRVLTCACGKVHTAAGITLTSTCTCDRNLWTQLWENGR